MINGIRVLLIDSTVAAIAIGDVIPLGRASEPKCPVILCSRYQPFPRGGITSHVFNFCDRKALVEGGPGAAPVGGSIDTPVVTDIDDLGVARHESQAVLVWMDTIGALRCDIGPVPCRARKVSSQGVDGTVVHLVFRVGCRGDVPVVPSLINAQRRRHRGDLGPDSATASPEMPGPT